MEFLRLQWSIYYLILRVPSGNRTYVQVLRKSDVVIHIVPRLIVLSNRNAWCVMRNAWGLCITLVSIHNTYPLPWHVTGHGHEDFYTLMPGAAIIITHFSSPMFIIITYLYEMGNMIAFFYNRSYALIGCHPRPCFREGKLQRESISFFVKLQWIPAYAGMTKVYWCFYFKNA